MPDSDFEDQFKRKREERLEHIYRLRVRGQARWRGEAEQGVSMTRKARSLGGQRGGSQGPGEKLPLSSTCLGAFRCCRS